MMQVHVGVDGRTLTVLHSDLAMEGETVALVNLSINGNDLLGGPVVLRSGEALTVRAVAPVTAPSP